MIPINNFTDKEIQALKEFKEKIADLGLNQTDFYYIKWLRARDLNVKAADEMLRISLRWRKDNNLDEVLSWQAPQQFQHEFPYDLDGFDKDGCPIAVIPFGKWDVRRAVAEGQKDVYLRYFDQLCERALEILSQKNKSRPANDPLTQLMVIFDLEGFSIRQISSKGTVDAILEGVKRTESNYPEILKISFIVNAPRVFSLLFALIKPLLTPRTLAKVQLHGSNSSKWKSQLLNLVPADQLLTMYGGTRTQSSNSYFMAVKGKATGGNEDAPGDGMCIVTVNAGDILKVALDIKHPNSTLSWTFRTDDFDISFALVFNETDKIIAHEKVDSHVTKQEGSHVCAKAGRYTLVFDNTYSMVRSKTLYYVTSIVSPENDEDEVF